ncbi:coiled-coil domain-containing protein 124 [Lonchura striata]|uniref:Coiled-coil domain-containing protein 124 n=1 Tax=Lonchura striata TaxID=40157 RepID=A0A218U7R2_9PASE|nr:coiled-coil domain-containing protein 124 [Lonchura striata domestica]OWK49753.1 Coiled-coil domain-containing protein 124 [Lonchura striata domestica]
MPKKFQGENSKSAAARARRAEAKAAAEARRQQELEDELWKDEDKHVLRKEQRKEEREKRRLEQLERRKELQRLLEEEDSKLKGKTSRQGNAGKITRAQIEENVRKEQRESTEAVEKEKSHLELPLEENLNRRLPEEGAVEARSIEDAIAALSVSQPLERHPERRLRAAFAAFEELQLPRLRREHPNLRLSQLRQLLRKEWLRAPENPLNQRHAPHGGAP